MIGYAVGIGETSYIFQILLSKEGYSAILASYSILLVGVSIMSYVKRIGSNRNLRMTSDDEVRKIENIDVKID